MVDMPTDITLEKAPGRVLRFLRAVSANGSIYRLLATRGYDQEVHKEGWTLLEQEAGSVPASLGEPELLNADLATAAMDELDQWDEPWFEIVRVTLARHFPQQRDFIFAKGLRAAQGPGAVLAVGTLLDRLDELESSPERQATRALDLQALERLASRGLNAQERQRLRGLIEQAQSLPSIPLELPSDDDEAAAQHLSNLHNLHLWWKEWSTIAQSVIARRSYLIQLGLAKRRSPQTS